MNGALRYLFASWPFQGHLFPQIAVAHALRSAGHACAFYTGSERLPTVQAEGFQGFPFRQLDEDRLARLMQERPAEPWRPSNLPRLGALLREWLLETIPHQVSDLELAIERWQPDVLVSDPTMWGPMVVLSEKHSLRVAVCSFIPAYPNPGPDAPPFGPGLPRHPRRLHQRVLVQVTRLSTRMSARAGRRIANGIRARHGLPPITTSVAEHIGRVPLYLVPCTPEFDYSRRDLPPGVHYVGPYLWNRPRTEPSTPWLEELTDEVPCVHVTEGTMHVHAPLLLRAALDGLAGLPMRVIVTTGDSRTAADLGASRVAANIRVERWVSHSDLLPRTQVMVTTGGAGSVLASLAAGVPLVIVPTEWDKPEIAQRVVESGCGVRLAPRHCTPDRLRASVQTVLANPAFRERARRLSLAFAAAGGAERAAELLIALGRRPHDDAPAVSHASRPAAGSADVASPGGIDVPH